MNTHHSTILSRQCGFTLLELMVTITVAAILMGVGLPSLKNVMLTNRVRSAATDMHLSLLLARSEAIKRNKNVQLTTGSWVNGWDVQVPIQSGVTSVIPLKSEDPLSGVNVACSGTCTGTITFKRTGRPTAFTELRVYVNGNNAIIARCVSISVGGRPRVKVDQNNDISDGCD